ncbi:MAG TPA: HepT-like ribonuclease domain-containing protein [Bacillota bacterium]|nr:HepT-like ribonuclease domain-containing protein [Bacillota bacterium]
MALTREAVLASTDRLSEAFRAARVRLAFLFGSVLDGGSAVQPRDLDIAVSFERYDFAAYLDLQERLHTILTAPQDRLDLVLLDRCGPLLQLQVVLAGFPLYIADRRLLDDFLQDAMFDYEDFQRFRREFRRELERRLGEGLSMAERKMDRNRVETYLSQLDEALDRLAELRRRVPSYEDFQADRDAPAYALSIKWMAGMRNAIVHVYWRLDLAAVYDSVSRRLGQFDEFARQVKCHLPPLTEEQLERDT